MPEGWYAFWCQFLKGTRVDNSKHDLGHDYVWLYARDRSIKSPSEALLLDSTGGVECLMLALKTV